MGRGNVLHHFGGKHITLHWKRKMRHASLMEEHVLCKLERQMWHARRNQGATRAREENASLMFGRKCTTWIWDGKSCNASETIKLSTQVWKETVLCKFEVVRTFLKTTHHQQKWCRPGSGHWTHQNQQNTILLNSNFRLCFSFKQSCLTEFQETQAPGKNWKKTGRGKWAKGCFPLVLLVLLAFLLAVAWSSVSSWPPAWEPPQSSWPSFWLLSAHFCFWKEHYLETWDIAICRLGCFKKVDISL